MQIDFKAIEKKWKERWEQQGVYRVTHEDPRPKFYVLDMFPYPSGSGLHVGHPLGYIASDIFSRYKRMDGYNVLHPMGYDAFGLPAEQYAIQSGIHPSKSTADNIKRYRAQLYNLGFSYDWSREVKTSDPRFYKWTQWIFLQLYSHFYDSGKGKAQPIDQLIHQFETRGNSHVEAATSQEDHFTADEWRAMPPQEQDAVLMNYRLAYRKISYVNWCEALGTVLANDEVKDGVSERGGYPVERRAMLQWSLRITAYAERLLRSLERLEWTDSMKTIQSHWIGRSEGADLFFEIEGSAEHIKIFTTRPDTIFGATYMVLAPEHPLIAEITTPAQRDVVDKYLDYVKTRSERDRIAEVREVTGVFTGAYAIHPLTETKIPIWTADYVLMDYGTGAIMAVPSDDERDAAFAEKYDLPVVEVIDRSAEPDAEMEDRRGILINSGFLNGMEVEAAIKAILDRIEEKGIGKRQVQYRMRDAIFSRQRYWGEPIPIVYDKNGVSHAVPASELPLELPALEDFKPSGTSSPLARLETWVHTPEGKRETDTMPGYAGSSWYFLRYMDPGNDTAFASKEALEYWRDVDLYIGGTEHAVGHLMYARFWHKFLYDKGLVPTDEPFRKLVNQGMIQGVIEYVHLLKEKVDGQSKFVCATLIDNYPKDAYVKLPVKIDFVENYGSDDSFLSVNGIRKFIEWRPEYGGAMFESKQGVIRADELISGSLPDEFRFFTQSEVGKMGKRYYNTVNPDDIVRKYGADCFRMYEMFLGPVDQSKPWDMQNIDGVSRFIRRFWNLFFDDGNTPIADDSDPTKEQMRILHYAIKRVGDDIGRLSFNTCISHFMTATNDLKKAGARSRKVLEPLVVLLAPFAPFITEEIWEKLGYSTSVHTESYPDFDSALLKKDSIVYPVCINGKKRGEATFDADAAREEIEQSVLEMDVVQKWVDGKPVKKVIIVPRRMINIVV